MKKRLFSIFTALTLSLTLLPTAAFAENEVSGEETSLCSCETVCTEGAMNLNCPTCGAENAQPEDCCAPKPAASDSDQVEIEPKEESENQDTLSPSDVDQSESNDEDVFPPKAMKNRMSLHRKKVKVTVQISKVRLIHR